MDIEIKRIITNEYFDGNFITVDLNLLEDFIKENLRDKNYGDSVVKYYFGFELFKFDGGFAQFFQNDITSWKTKNKWFISNSHFDWNVFKDLDSESVLEIIKVEFLKSIDRIDVIKRKPKNFDYKSFRNDLKEILDRYRLGLKTNA